MHMFAVLCRLAWRYLWRNHRRTIIMLGAITVGAFTNKVTLGFTSDIKNLVPTLAVFKPTLVVSVPRASQCRS